MPFWRSEPQPAEPESDAKSVAESEPKNDPVASASQAAGTAWLAGHLNHLTEDQEKKLEEFKKLCEKEGYYKPEIDGQRPSHDDATMLYVSLWSLLPNGLQPVLMDPLQAFLARAQVRYQWRMGPVQGYGGLAQGERYRRTVREYRGGVLRRRSEDG